MALVTRNQEGTPVNRDPAFGRRLAQLMDARGTTIAELAVRLPVHPVTLSKWRGGHVPVPARLARLAGLLGVSAEWLRTGTGPKEPDEQDQEVLAAQRRFREAYGEAALEISPYVERGETVPPALAYSLLRQVFEAGMEAIRRPSCPALPEELPPAGAPRHR